MNALERVEWNNEWCSFSETYEKRPCFVIVCRCFNIDICELSMRQVLPLSKLLQCFHRGTRRHYLKLLQSGECDFVVTRHYEVDLLQSE